MKTNRALMVLSKCRHEMVHATDEKQFLSKVCQLIVDAGGYLLAWVGYAENDNQKSVRPMGQAGFEDGYLETVDITWEDTERGRGPTGTSIRTGEAIICRNIMTDPEFAPWREEASKRGYASSISLPFKIGGGTLGALNIYATEADAFDSEEIDLLKELADDLTYGVSTLRERAESHRTEEALRFSEARYKQIVEYTKNGVAVYQAVNEGENFIFVDFNRAAERIEKVKREEVIGKEVGKVFPGVSELGLLNVMKRVWSSGKPEHLPVSLYKDQRIVGWRDNFVYKLPSGEIVAVYSDETERKQSEAALQKAHGELYRFSQDLEKKVQKRTKELEEKNKQLIEAERLAALGRMANRVAHELRNPLMVIGGFARRMNKKVGKDDPLKQYLKIILSEVEVLENKVSEIIRIEEKE